MNRQQLINKIAEICPDAIVKEEFGELVIATGWAEPDKGQDLIAVDQHAEILSMEGRTPTHHYFSPDGNFGDANGLIIVETTDWTDNDWVDLEEARDYERPQAAEAISERHN